MGFCFFRDQRKFKLDMQRLLRRLHRRGKYHPDLKELKFSPRRALEKLGCTRSDIQAQWEPSFDYVRKKVIDLILRHADGVYAGILDKRTMRGTDWTSELLGNYIFSQTLFKDILPLVGFSSAPDVIYDRGRLGVKSTISFNKYLEDTYEDFGYLDQEQHISSAVHFRDEDSEKNPGLWGADIVAGSFPCMHALADPTYVNLLRPKFLESGSRNFLV